MNLRNFYEERFHAMEDALSTEMPAWVTWTKPTGGFFIWLTLPEFLDAEMFLEESILKEKVSFVIGRPFTIDSSARNCLRLAFSVEEPDRIREGIARLAGLIRRL
jgi:DNA-binding transcriptional MocR family regulator